MCVCVCVSGKMTLFVALVLGAYARADIQAKRDKCV